MGLGVDSPPVGGRCRHCLLKNPVLLPTAPAPDGSLSHSPRLELWSSMTLPGAPWNMHDMSSMLPSTPCRMSDVRSGTWDLTHAPSHVKPPIVQLLGGLGWGWASTLHLWVAVAGAASHGSCSRRVLLLTVPGLIAHGSLSLCPWLPVSLPTAPAPHGSGICHCRLCRKLISGLSLAPHAHCQSVIGSTCLVHMATQ